MPTYVLTGVEGKVSSIAASYALTLAQPTDTLIFTSPCPAFIPRPLFEACTASSAHVRILMVSYNDPANLARAFSGADVVAFVSSPNYLAGAARRAQHRNVIEAAQRARIRRIVYMSLVGAESGETDDGAAALAVARDHAFTERLVRESGLVWNVQRNCLFVDSVAPVPVATDKTTAEPEEIQKKWKHAALVAREDCGRVLGALLMGKGEPNKVYIVAGP
ncbi:hypothetical protein BD289DRAFT_347214, partial [Coniella lustricola]